MSSTQAYRPDEYWERLVGRRFDLREVGYPELSLAFNETMYAAMASTTRRGLRRLGVDPARVRDARVLDVGSGVGFWVDFWAGLGARDITGVDLTRASTERLAERYPHFRFEQRDIGEPVPEAMLGAFDLVSVMSVFNHIPDPRRWETALENVGRMLRPGGVLLVMDPMLRHTWRGADYDAASNGRVRTIGQHAAALERVGVDVELVLPTVSLLMNPVDTRTRAEAWLLWKWWAVFARIAAREKAMRAARPLAYALDRAVCALGYQPSSKVLFARKRAA
ncbi:MAG TPA: class I SAM-dependent methyltransferase [Longimicrobium sp.]|nr:class I SAM-dependent methyltransferase [Longimicrobium sp.]